jgi:4-hydroxy-tetrahydrodipicolinate reductase
MNLAIVGYGKMGRRVEHLAPQYGFTVGLKIGRDDGAADRFTKESFQGIDAAVEFSTPKACVENVERLAALGVNTVVGTTGWLDRIEHVRGAVQRSGAALVWGPNFSVGANIFMEIVGTAARLMAAEHDYGAWAWEIHHAAKKDAPSGTLRAMLREIEKSGYSREVNVAANRAGSHPGTHELGFDSPDDTITLRHTARSRDAFARGALRAARWMKGKKGFYEFREILDDLGP